MTKNHLFSLATILFLTTLPTTAFSSYLTAREGKLYNSASEPIRLTGVNWFGFETSNLAPHGLWVRDYHGILKQIQSLGFNTIRIPFCDAMFAPGAKVSSINDYGIDPLYVRNKTELNKELIGKPPLAVLDEIITYAGTLGLVVILDNHSREPDGYMTEKLWYTAVTSEETWVDNWVMLASRYKDNPTVVGFDLNNEPHGKTSEQGATWGTGNTTSDWNSAAQKCGNAILAVNPDVLIIIEGIEQVGSTMYWWGGNLRGIEKAPIVLSKPNKLMYSAHEYGPEVFQQPWFKDASFPENLTSIWDASFGFVVKEKKAPLLIGEFGIKAKTSYGGKSGVWFDTFLKYLADNMMSWTFWCFNPNSGDTGGLLSYDWITVEQWKIDLLKPYCAPMLNPMGTIPQIRHTFVHPTLKRRGYVLTAVGKALEKPSIALYTVGGRLIRSQQAATMPLAGLAGGTYIAQLSNGTALIGSTRFTLCE